MTLETASVVEFAKHLGEEFRIQVDAQANLVAELVSAKGQGFTPRPGGGQAERESFSLLFRVPKTWRYPQQIYRLMHPVLGELDLFLVPVGLDERGMQLEAIFNFI